MTGAPILTEVAMPPHGALRTWLLVRRHAALRLRRAILIACGRCPRCTRRLSPVVNREEWRWGTHMRTGRSCARRCTFLSDVMLVEGEGLVTRAEDDA